MSTEETDRPYDPPPEAEAPPGTDAQDDPATDDDALDPEESGTGSGESLDDDTSADAAPAG